MRHEDLPERWRRKLADYLAERGEPGRARLHAGDFHMGSVAELSFDDGSRASFRYPLVIEAPELREVAVFTEHCGYHVFPLIGTQVAIEPEAEA